MGTSGTASRPSVADNGISSVFEQAAREAGVTRRISARVSAHETICTLVARGMGVAVVPLYLKARHAHLDIRFIRLTGPWSSTPLCIAVRDPDALAPAARTLPVRVERHTRYWVVLRPAG